MDATPKMAIQKRHINKKRCWFFSKKKYHMKLNLSNAIIDKVTTMKDRSLKVTLITRELPPEEMSALFSQLQQEAEIEFDIAPEDGGKSHASRMRASLFRLWEA